MIACKSYSLIVFCVYLESSTKNISIKSADLELWQKVLTEMVSCKDSVNEDGGNLTIRPLPWRSERVSQGWTEKL